MLPEFQAKSLQTDISYSVKFSYVSAVVDEAEEKYDLYDVSPSTTFTYRIFKRAFDIAVVLLLFPFVLFVGVFIAALVALDSPGPVLFSHSRIRRDGERFHIMKFRTMCVRGSEVLAKHFELYPSEYEEWKENHKLRNDPRVSKLGAFLRRTSLDELPQIWNVLIGEMSLVGPRPIVEEEVQKYGPDFVYYTAIKPGITGLWQTSGRSTLSYPERVALDRFYVENWSFWLEVKILVRTIRSIVLCDGAY